MKFPEIIAVPRQPTEKFHFHKKEVGFSIIDFWQWSISDLIENRNRGILAEFLVKKALQIESEVRLEWDAYDFETNAGIKVEVKSSAYIQSWKQKGLSRISFGISPTKILLDDNNYSDERKRQADVYIFCLLHSHNQDKVNPVDLSQWTFYIVSTHVLDEMSLSQKSIGMSGITKIKHKKCNYLQLKPTFEKVVKAIPSRNK